MENERGHNLDDQNMENQSLNEHEEDENQSFQLDESLITCGIGPCKPKFAQKFATIKGFTANAFIINLIYVAFFAYSGGVMRTIEKRFGFQSVETGAIYSIMDITTTCLVIVVGYIGDRSHKPRILSIMMSLLGISMIFCFAGSYFFFAPESNFEGNDQIENNTTNTQLCQTYEAEPEASCAEDTAKSGKNRSAYVLLMLGGFLAGVGGSSCISMIFGYVDENINKEDSAVYIGIVLAGFPVGPMVGFALAGVTLTLPENLRDSPYETSDPRFIGAWWLGFLILGICMLLSCIPTFFFPKHLPKYFIEKQKSLQIVDKTDKPESGVIKQLKDFFWSIWKLISNPALMTLLLTSICQVYMVQVGGNLPRYLEIHFRMAASSANLMAGLVGSFSAVLGNLGSGWIMKKLKMTPTKAALFYSAALASTLVGLLILMLIPCPQPEMAGTGLGKSSAVDMACNFNCSCNQMKFDPVCDFDGTSHFSACHAGCDVNFGNNTYGGCACSSSDKAVPGVCQEPCGTLPVYGTVFFLMAMFGALGEVPATVLLLRVGGEKQKSLALGVFSFFSNILGFVPAPVIYGGLFDSSCLLWEKLCSGTGVCLHFDIKQFRLKLHGVTAIFLLCSLILSIITYFLIRRSGMKFVPAEETTTENESVKKITTE